MAILGWKPPPSRLNCCIACLAMGVSVCESLHHITFECPTYAELHQARVIKHITHDRILTIFCLHRDIWSLRQLKAIRLFFALIYHRRCSLMGGSGHIAAQNAQSNADLMWDLLHA